MTNSSIDNPVQIGALTSLPRPTNIRFNDIVVDVTQTTAQVYTINSETGEATPKEGSSPVVTQEAKISSLCGTLPFQVKVGDTYFGQVTNPTASVADIEAQLARGASEHGGTVCPSGTRPAGVPLTYTKVIDNNTWNPESNNVSAFVWTNRDPSVDPADNSVSGVWESTFPLDGEVPYIIAVDQDVVPDVLQ